MNYETILRMFEKYSTIGGATKKATEIELRRLHAENERLRAENMELAMQLGSLAMESES